MLFVWAIRVERTPPARCDKSLHTLPAVGLPALLNSGLLRHPGCVRATGLILWIRDFAPLQRSDPASPIYLIVKI